MGQEAYYKMWVFLCLYTQVIPKVYSLTYFIMVAFFLSLHFVTLLLSKNIICRFLEQFYYCQGTREF